MSTSKITPTEPPLAPLGLVGSALMMGLPGALMLVLMRFGVPAAMENGVSQLVAFWIALYCPCLLMGLLSIFFYWRDGYEMTWAAFRERMRLGRLSAKTWLVVSGLTLLVLVLEASLEDLGPLMASVDLFSPPEWLGAPFNPNEEFPIPPSKFMGTELLGQWWIPLFYIPCLLANILGEELFWRGYMLPRQELVFGRWAFLVNGVFWIVLFHVALPWIWLTVIPSLVLIPLTAQILKSTWAPIVIHGFGNFILMIILVVGVLGL